MDLEDYIRDVPDFPKPGIMFKDITPLLAAPEALRSAIKKLVEKAATYAVDKVAAVESRGFLFGVPIASELGVGFVPIRKPGKLPWQTSKVEYVLEYGTDAIEMHKDAIEPGESVLIVDDLLATGGTMGASIRLIEEVGGRVAACLVVVELGFLDGRKKLMGRDLHSLIRYD